MLFTQYGEPRRCIYQVLCLTLPLAPSVVHNGIAHPMQWRGHTSDVSEFALAGLSPHLGRWSEHHTSDCTVGFSTQSPGLLWSAAQFRLDHFFKRPTILCGYRRLDPRCASVIAHLRAAAWTPEYLDPVARRTRNCAPIMERFPIPYYILYHLLPPMSVSSV